MWRWFILGALLVTAPSNAGTLLLLGAGPGSSVSSVVTWNPSDKSANVTLSNGNLTAASSTNSNSTVRSTTSHSTGKYYFEFTSSDVITDTTNGIGLANGSQSLSGAIGDATTNGVGCFFAGNGVLYNNTNLGSCTTFVGSSIGNVAVDIGAGLYWARSNKLANWNNNGAANPSSGSGGWPFTITGPLFIALTLKPSGGPATITITLNVGATAYDGTPSLGFGNW